VCHTKIQACFLLKPGPVAPFSLLKALWPPTGFFQCQSEAEKEQLTALVQRKARRVARQTLLFSTHRDLQENSSDTLCVYPSLKEKANYFSYLRSLARVYDVKASMTSLSWAKKREKETVIPLLICAKLPGEKGFK
jgi:hypothetical protein